MIVVSSITDIRRELRAARSDDMRIGFVPTMGSLHAGHLTLIEHARKRCDFVVASIYVNPMQFGPQEDFAAYPRSPDADRNALESLETDLLFVPTDGVMYPRGLKVQTYVEVPDLGDVLCGKFRPGHFRGVTTVVNRLFNIVQPDVAVFGKKDYQQLKLIQLMVEDLAMPVDVVGVDTVREADGLAMSSRNQYLRPEERKLAARLYAVLDGLRREVQRLGKIPVQAEADAVAELQKEGFRVDYVSFVRQRDLAPAQAGDKQLALLAAAWMGRTRLIDNVEISLN
jgi:pantoate--beta-alanine ligase